MRITRITLKRFLVSLLGILTAEVSFLQGRPNGSQDECSNVREGEICYFFVANGEPNWNTAHRKCQNKNSSLPIIQNREEQEALEKYLRKQKIQSINDIWTSGKRKTYNNWAWLNNQTLSSTAIRMSHDYSAEKTHIVIQWPNWPITGTESTLKPERPLAPAWYLCQHKDRQCSGQQHEFNATNGCLIPSGYGNETWYEARNECLSKGGDLAILTDQDLQNFKNHSFPKNNYWIGLRRINWVWKTNNQASPEEEVKYTKWRRQSMPTDGDLCINIAANDGQWSASRCSNNVISVICEKRGNPKPSTIIISSTIEISTIITTTTQTTAIKPSSITSTTRRSPITSTMVKHNDITSTSHSVPTRIDSTSMKSTTATTAQKSQNTTVTAAATISRHNNVSSTPAQTTTDSTSWKSTTATTISNPNGYSSMTAYAAIGAGVVVIVILCIVVILLIIWRKSKPSNNKTEPEQTDSENAKETKVKKTKETKLSKPTEGPSIYADIPLAEKTANDAPDAGQKGTVYASLDFNQGVTYAEPSKLYTNTQNVSGPIYAEPLNATGNGATSAGSSPAVKIGPMGDVYALPTTSVTPSSDKTTERPIYANT